MKRSFCRDNNCAAQIVLDGWVQIKEKYPERKESSESKIEKAKVEWCRRCLAFQFHDWLRKQGFKLVTDVDDLDSTSIKKP